MIGVIRVVVVGRLFQKRGMMMTESRVLRGMDDARGMKSPESYNLECRGTELVCLAAISEDFHKSPNERDSLKKGLTDGRNGFQMASINRQYFRAMENIQ